MQCALLHVQMSSMATALTRTKWNSREFNYNSRFTFVVAMLACERERVWMCLKVKKNPHRKYETEKYNEILQASEKGKIIHMKHTPHVYSRTICTRNTRNIFHLLCERDLFHFKIHFRVFQHNTHRVPYICILLPDFRFRLWNLYVSRFRSKCLPKIHSFIVLFE